MIREEGSLPLFLLPWMGLMWPFNALFLAFALISSILSYANHRTQLEHIPCNRKHSFAGWGELEDASFLPENTRLSMACNALYNRSTVI